MSEITQILQEANRGERGASEELLPLVYDELRRHARRSLSQESAGQTLQPTALVHEAWLRLFGTGTAIWQNRGHFFGAAAETMRRILIENARRKARLKRGANPFRLTLDQIELAETTPEEKVLLIDEALERFKAQEPEKARVVILKFFGGLTNEEVADAMGVTERTIERYWAYSKAWLFQNIQTAR